MIFDRDGTLIKYVPYLHDSKNVELMYGCKEALSQLKSSGFKFFLHTNQSGISRGYYTRRDVDNCNHKLVELLDLGSCVFEEICVADELEVFEDVYRKPSVKFAHEIIKKYSVAKEDLIYIGDNTSDLETAINIGCYGIGLKSNNFDLKTFVDLNDNKKLLLFHNWNEILHFLLKY